MFDLFLEPRQLLLEEWRGTIPITRCEYCRGESLVVPEGLLGILPFPYIGGSYVQPAAALRPQKKEQFTTSAVVAALQVDGQKPLTQLLVQTLSFANNYRNLVVPSSPWEKCLGKVMYFVLSSTLCK